MNHSRNLLTGWLNSDAQKHARTVGVTPGVKSENAARRKALMAAGNALTL